MASNPIRGLRTAAESGDAAAREILADAVAEFPEPRDPKPGEWYCILTYGYHFYGEIGWTNSNYIFLKPLAWCVFDIGPFVKAFPPGKAGSLKYAERLPNGYLCPHNTVQGLIPVFPEQPKVESEK